MRVALAEIPVQARAEAAWWAVREFGADPYDALHVALWPDAIVDVESTELADGFCSHGHPRTEANTYRNPRTGWIKCRACSREQKRNFNRTAQRKNRRKVPCAYCGEPATAPEDKGTGGLDTPRCRRCFLAQYKSRRAVA